MSTGRVKVFFPEKRFGFIITDDPKDNGGQDLFFYENDVAINYVPEERVEYTVGSGKKGPQAENVKKI